MEELIQQLIKNNSEVAQQNIAQLSDKTIKADRLSLLEADLLEAKDALLMLARLYEHVGLPFKALKETVDCIVSNYRDETFRGKHCDRPTDHQKIASFARKMISEALSYKPVVALLSQEGLLKDSNCENQQQNLWYRGFCLLIPVAMRHVIESNNLEVYVYGMSAKERGERW